MFACPLPWNGISRIHGIISMYFAHIIRSHSFELPILR